MYGLLLPTLLYSSNVILTGYVNYYLQRSV